MLTECFSYQSSSMVVPDSASVVPQPDNGSPTGLTENSEPGCEVAGEGGQDLAGVELEEVRKLQELVRRLEVQNETLRNRGSKTVIHRGANSNLTAAVNINKRLACEEVTNSHLRLEHSSSQLDSRDLMLSPPQDSSSGEEMSPLPVASSLEEEDDEEEEDRGLCGGFLKLTSSNGAAQSQGQSQTPESPSQESYESETLAESDSGVDQTALDEVDVLDLDDECADIEDEESWYVSLSAMLSLGVLWSHLFGYSRHLFVALTVWLNMCSRDGDKKWCSYSSSCEELPPGEAELWSHI